MSHTLKIHLTADNEVKVSSEPRSDQRTAALWPKIGKTIIAQVQAAEDAGEPVDMGALKVALEEHGDAIGACGFSKVEFTRALPSTVSFAELTTEVGDDV